MTDPRIVRWGGGEALEADATSDVDAFAASLRASDPGGRVDVCDPPLIDALTAAGAALARRSLLMVLEPLPEPAATSAATSFDADAPFAVQTMEPEPARHATALLDSFPPTHPDYDPSIADLASAEAALRSYFEGRVIGPYLGDASIEACDREGTVVGGIVVARMPADDSFEGGPWVTEVYVDPDHQGEGIGRQLFGAAIERLRAAGEARLALSVQVDNPAAGLYSRLGFVERSRWCRFVL